jgi:plastocyanin
MKRFLLLIGLCLAAYTCSKGEDNSPIAPIKYTVSVSATSGGSVSTSGGEYNENTSVSITANPQQGFEFSGWTGTNLTGSSISVKVISNQTITANFTRSIYTLTIVSVGSGEVTQQIINSARGEDYESGKNIRLTATPESEFLFYDWEQLQNNLRENSYENPLDIVMDQSKTVTATFEEKLPLINPDNTDKNNTVGKWKIRKKRPGSQSSTSARVVDCDIDDIILRSDYSFTIITQTQTITGQYTIGSETSISLYQGETNIGMLTDIILTESFISFNIDLTGVCNEILEADKDPTYDEATDPIAPSNTGSSTIASKPCTIDTELTSENINQTISLGDSIQNILIAVTVGSTCTETLSVSSSNLPEGVSVSLDNNQITISGTPLSNLVGTFDYDIILNVASPTSIISGTITVENNTTTETNPNQGGGGNNSGTVSDTNNTGTTTSADTTPPVISITGQARIFLNYGDTYTDQGATATDDVSGDLTSSIVTTNPVDTLNSGTYTVTYTVTDAASNTTSIGRIVTVNEIAPSPDLTPPVILITGSASITLTEGDTYADAGATATDDVSGDLTSSIVTTNPVDTSTPGTYTVTYTVTDAASNTTSIGRIVNVNAAPSADTTPPVISITGSASITITERDTYTDQGATATDDVSGDLTSSIVTTNPVDTSTPGTYTVTYTVTDAASNTTSIGRIVNVNAAISVETYTINVTASNASDYTLSGADRNGNVTGNDPSVTVNIGDTIDFAVDASGHPFYLKTVQGTGTSDLISDVTNNGATNGTVSWTPTASGTYYYQCSLHNGMYGTITVN